MRQRTYKYSESKSVVGIVVRLKRNYNQLLYKSFSLDISVDTYKDYAKSATSSSHRCIR